MDENIMIGALNTKTFEIVALGTTASPELLSMLKHQKEFDGYSDEIDGLGLSYVCYGAPYLISIEINSSHFIPVVKFENALYVLDYPKEKARSVKTDRVVPFSEIFDESKSPIDTTNVTVYTLKARKDSHLIVTKNAADEPVMCKMVLLSKLEEEINLDGLEINGVVKSTGERVDLKDVAHRVLSKTIEKDELNENYLRISHFNVESAEGGVKPVSAVRLYYPLEWDIEVKLGDSVVKYDKKVGRFVGTPEDLTKFEDCFVPLTVAKSKGYPVAYAFLVSRDSEKEFAFVIQYPNAESVGYIELYASKDMYVDGDLLLQVLSGTHGRESEFPGEGLNRMRAKDFGYNEVYSQRVVNREAPRETYAYLCDESEQIDILYKN